MASKLTENQTAVGGTIFKFDINRRVYLKTPGDRMMSGGPIYREHWRPVRVVGETSRSWIVESYRGPKVPKRGPHPGYAFYQGEVDDDCWVHEHRRHICRWVQSCQEADTLRRIATLVGYPHG